VKVEVENYPSFYLGLVLFQLKTMYENSNARPGVDFKKVGRTVLSIERTQTWEKMK
jgi:hypothetical protein